MYGKRTRYLIFLINNDCCWFFIIPTRTHPIELLSRAQNQYPNRSINHRLFVENQPNFIKLKKYTKNQFQNFLRFSCIKQTALNLQLQLHWAGLVLLLQWCGSSYIGSQWSRRCHQRERAADCGANKRDIHPFLSDSEKIGWMRYLCATMISWWHIKTLLPHPPPPQAYPTSMTSHWSYFFLHPQNRLLRKRIY